MELRHLRYFVAIGEEENYRRDVVTFKRSCRARVSYRFICKRLERLGRISPGQFDDIQFQKLEEQIYGVPFYKRRRQRKRAAVILG